MPQARLYAAVTTAESTVSVTAAAGGAGQAIPVSTASIAVSLNNGNTGPVEYKVGAGAWTPLFQQSGIRLDVDLSVNQVLLRKGATDPGPEIVGVVVESAGAIQTEGGIAVGAASTPTSFRHVATRCYPPRNLMSAGVGRRQNTRSTHKARAPILNPGAVFANWRIGSGATETTHGAGTIKVALEYPVGVYTLANECVTAANGPVAFPIGNTTLTFGTPGFPLAIPPGAEFYMRVLQINDNGTVFMQYQSSACAMPGDGWETSTDTTDRTTSGTFSPNVITYHPIAIFAKSSEPAVLYIGDSRGEGGSEGVTDGTGDHGECARAIGRHFPYANMCVSATTQAQWNSASRTYRQEVYQYFTHVMNGYGVNDMGTGGTAAGTITARQAAAVAFKAAKSDFIVIGTTLCPYTGTTDGYRTTANQALTGANNVKVQEFNRLVRAGGIAAEDFTFEVADVIDPFRLGRWPVTRNPNDTAYPNLCEFTASLATNGVMTVTAIASGTIKLGDTLVTSLTGTAPQDPHPGMAPISQLTGTAGSTGTYQLNKTVQSAITSRTFYTGGFMTNDGLHGSQFHSEMIRDSAQAAVMQEFVRATS